MKTFILMWRPAISSYKMEDLEHELQHDLERMSGKNGS